VSALASVRCAGAPRDLGIDQGVAARSMPRSAGFALARQVARDLERFFPHHAERTQGIALGARVPEAALAAELAALLRGDPGFAATAGGFVARSIAAPSASLVLRASAPDNDYRSLELATAWSPASWIGVNEHGLAATATALPAGETSVDGCAAPAQLLVQDVLQRFDTAEKAADWALRRPAGGRASLLVADASGARFAVEIEGRARKLLDAAEGPLVGLGPAAGVAALEKALGEARALDAGALARLLAEASAPAVVAVADPVGRRLGVALGGAKLEWHELHLVPPPTSGSRHSA
jgi:hypothetical protein